MKSNSNPAPPSIPEGDWPPGTGLENIGPEHVAWLGEDGELDPDVLLADKGYDPFSAFELLLLSIIDAHPSDEAGDRGERLERAAQALFGTKRKRGRDTRDDYDLLLQIAWRYHRARFAQPTGKIDLGPIIRECIELYGMPKLAQSLDSEVRRLRIKFNEDKDLFLARVTSECDWERMNVVREVAEIARRLERVGIKHEPRTIRARLRS